jgi:hypothetical protein
MTTVQDYQSEKGEEVEWVPMSAEVLSTVFSSKATELPAPPTGKTEPSKVQAFTGYGPKPHNGGRPAAIMQGGRGGRGAQSNGQGSGQGGGSGSANMKEQYKERSQHQSSDQPRRDGDNSRSACWFCNEPGHQEKECELKAKFRNQLRN